MPGARAFPRNVVAIVLLLFVLALVQPASAATPTDPIGQSHARDRRTRWHATTLRNRMLWFVNDSRAAHGLSPLRLNARLSEGSWSHTMDMVRRSLLFHTSTVEMLVLVRPFGATVWGENIGYAATLNRVEQLWMHSWEHRVNILDPLFHFAGIGVVHARGWFWVTLRLYG